MRLISAITGAFLVAFAVPAASQAADPPAAAAGAAATNMTTAPQCTCRPVRHFVRHVVRHRRRVRHYVRHWRHRVPVPVPVAIAPPPYNPLLPSPLDTAYDRAMTLHERSAPVSGFFVDPGYAPTPPVAGVMPYRLPAYAGVYQYDGLTGQYIRLAAGDAQRSGVAVPPPPPPAPAPH
ncbi:MAG TPA: hypothetical protein VNF04_06790 [Stellaceae bacterium]|nr:hypothetical protein [Stellaceae bacterium]